MVVMILFRIIKVFYGIRYLVKLFFIDHLCFVSLENLIYIKRQKTRPYRVLSRLPTRRIDQYIHSSDKKLYHGCNDTISIDKGVLWYKIPIKTIFH